MEDTLISRGLYQSRHAGLQNADSLEQPRTYEWNFIKCDDISLPVSHRHPKYCQAKQRPSTMSVLASIINNMEGRVGSLAKSTSRPAQQLCTLERKAG